MESKERTSASERVVRIIEEHCPDVHPELVLTDPCVIACDYTPNPRVLYGRRDNIPETEAFLKVLYTCIPNVDRCSDGERLIDIRDCRELQFKNGEKVYIIPSSEKAKLKDGFHLKNEKIEKLTRQYTSRDERVCAEALTGEIPYVVPILAGLKPACLFYAQEVDGKLFTISDIVSDGDSELKFFTEDNNSYLMYRPELMKEVVQRNAALFLRLGITASTPTEEIIKEVLIHILRGTKSFDPADLHVAIGLLLGFDARSVYGWQNEKRNENQPDFPNNIWRVMYIIADWPNNPEYDAFSARYDALQKHIEDLLEKGATPSEVLKMLRFWKIEEDTRTQVVSARLL